ncbi:hypothetical protein [Paenibacillus xylaniclasticus]|uniref:hypothetical protein n=1 Tax=Paenibacillus xylaniclasticus TaxID=588083 RepID=UPI000FD98577|nr:MULTISPECIES: hypothetical protein [Paenibacillus]GFN31357.1 hypothetical protein PCURB6_16170 [Paenibacillus curdlanolyticus]
MKSINPTEYTLEADCTSMQVLTPDMAENLEEVMRMYKATGFKKINASIKSNNTLKLQLSRLSRRAGISDIFTIVEV